MTDIQTHEFPKWITNHYYRPTDTATNVNKMRKDATKNAVHGGYATIHHHGANDACRTDRTHEYFGFGPHEKCDNLGCSGCDDGWKKH